ncbi:hypothetical protein V6N11_058595 [Hibiscus sabdariffa]|uniref:Uncharacterized protein n=1 Tax=Hibiscus sabdariffa TaxID=183260 RepID=A0ABR2U4P2_9ROSI
MNANTASQQGRGGRRQDSRDSFWRWKKWSLPRLPNPPLPPLAPILDGFAATWVEDTMGGQSLCVEGVIDEVKLAALETCTLGRFCRPGLAALRNGRHRWMYPIVVQEAELVWVPAIEQHKVVAEAILSDQSQETVKHGVVIGEHRVASPAITILGPTGAAMAPIIGSAQGGARKVKSVNSLVEALGSPAQQRVITAARSIQGRRRLTKGNYMVDAGVEEELRVVS